MTMRVDDEVYISRFGPRRKVLSTFYIYYSTFDSLVWKSIENLKLLQIYYLQCLGHVKVHNFIPQLVMRWVVSCENMPHVCLFMTMRVDDEVYL